MTCTPMHVLLPSINCVSPVATGLAEADLRLRASISRGVAVFPPQARSLPVEDSAERQVQFACQGQSCALRHNRAVYEDHDGGDVEESEPAGDLNCSVDIDRHIPHRGQALGDHVDLPTLLSIMQVPLSPAMDKCGLSVLHKAPERFRGEVYQGDRVEHGRFRNPLAHLGGR